MMKRLMALMLALCVCAGLLADMPAARAASYAVYVVSNTLKVYKSASASSQCLGTMAYGEKMSCLAVSGKWAKVQNDAGAVGYCDFAALSTADPNTMNVSVTVSSANAPLYKKPDTGTAVWMKLKKGAKYTAVAMTRDNQWVRLKNGKYYGYIQAKHLSSISATPSPTPTATPKPSATPEPLTGTAYVTATLTRLRQSASDGAKELAALGYGERVTLISASGDWARVKSSANVTGYCPLKDLCDCNPNTLSAKVTINAIAPIYRVPDASTAVWMKLKKNSKYTAVAVTPDGEWTRIQNGAYFAYIRSTYVTFPGGTPSPSATASSSPSPTPKPTATPTATPAPEPSEVFVAVNALTVRKSASDTAKALATLGYGEGATLLSVEGSWAKLRLADGSTGYCGAGSLTSKDPNTYAQTVYINAANAPIYHLPLSGQAVWTRLKKGASYTAVAITLDGEWFRLRNGIYYGYIPKQYVSANDIAGERTVYISVTSLPVYASASENSALLGNMYLGQSMTCIGTADGWSKVRNDAGEMGYCLVSGLTSKDPNTLNRPYYAKTNGVKLYQKPLTSAKVTQSVNANASLMAVCLSPDNKWARVALGDGGFAYALLSDLSEQKPDDGTIIADIDPVQVYVVPTTLTVYASARTTAKSLGTMGFGEAMTCTGKSSSWARVVNDAGAVGYCDVNSVTTKNPNSYASPLYAQAKDAKLYRKPQTSAAVEAKLALNAQVTGLCYNEDRSWYRVKYGDSCGYVQAAYFAATPMTEEASGTVGKVISLAKEQLGVPYVYTGQSPNGFDCSGLTYYVFKNAAKITLKRTAHSQGYDNTYQKITDKAQLKVGDLLFFNTVSDGDDDLCDHVGIYLGNGQFIHASSGGGKVMISSLGTNKNSYYFRTYSWARRVLN